MYTDCDKAVVKRVSTDPQILKHKQTFETDVTKTGGGGHIIVPKFLIGCRVRVTLEVIG